MKRETRSTKHTDNQQTPRRSPSRLEGVVKNTGIKTKEKKSKEKKESD